MIASAAGTALWCVLAAGGGLAGGRPEARPLYQLDRARMPRIEAEEYRVKDPIYDIFSVPEKNAVGTNSLHNAITVLELKNGKVKDREVRRGFISSVSAGDKIYLPEFSKDTIGYVQTRGFLLFNVKTGEFRDQLMVRFLEKTLEDVAVLDWEKRLFLFNVEFLPGFNNKTTELHVMDLSGAEPKDVARFDVGADHYGIRLGPTTLLLKEESSHRVLYALNADLRPADHPLLRVFNHDHHFREVGVPLVHPSLPVAVFAEEEREGTTTLNVWSATWTPGDKVTLYKLAEGMSGGFRFSPDGKWMLFRDRTKGPLYLIVMPVDRALPHYFGPPILLKTEEAVSGNWNGNCAWISDPVSVVCHVRKTLESKLTGEDFEESKLLRWELTPGKVKRP